MNGNWPQPAECMCLTVCFLHWGQDKCYPPPHGQNKGWAPWTKNADSALSYQLAWKTTTCYRKQSYTVSSFLQTGEGKKSIPLNLVPLLYDPRAIKYNHPSLTVLMWVCLCPHLHIGRFNEWHTFSLLHLCVCWVKWAYCLCPRFLLVYGMVCGHK